MKFLISLKPYSSPQRALRAQRNIKEREKFCIILLLIPLLHSQRPRRSPIPRFHEDKFHEGRLCGGLNCYDYLNLLIFINDLARPCAYSWPNLSSRIDCCVYSCVNIISDYGPKLPSAGINQFAFHF